MRLRHLVLVGFEDDDLGKEEWNELARSAERISRVPEGTMELAAVLRDADALLVQMGVSVTRSMLELAPCLRYIGVFATSMAFIDEEAFRRGIVVRNVPEYATEAVAELAIALAIEHLRNLPEERVRGARGDWSETRRWGRELRSARVGVLGLGPIGRRVTEILVRGFGADVLAFHPRARAERAITQASLDEVLARSEVLLVHLPLTRETRGLVEARKIASIPDGTLVVALAPLAVFDLHALIARVVRGSISLVTDHADELAAELREALFRAERCTLLPPIGYKTREAEAARRQGLVRALRAYVAGDERGG